MGLELVVNIENSNDVGGDRDQLNGCGYNSFLFSKKWRVQQARKKSYTVFAESLTEWISL